MASGGLRLSRDVMSSRTSPYFFGQSACCGGWCWPSPGLRRKCQGVLTGGEPAGWRVFFVDPAQRPVLSDPLVARFAGKMPDLLRSHDRVAGQPFLLGPYGRPDVRVNTFFSRYPMTARDPDTWRKYAYALGMWLNFLAARGAAWDNAVPEDVEAFKYWRMADERNPQRVAAGTVTGNLIALNVFYSWAAGRYGVVSPVVTRQVRAPARTGKTTIEQIVASPVGVRRAGVTCWLAGACAKGGHGSRFWLPRPALTGVLSYMEGARASAVRRAQRAGRYERATGVLIVEKVHSHRRLRVRDRDGAVHGVSLDALDPATRGRLFRRTDAGLEPVAVWLNEDGLPRNAHGWEHSFTRASQRLARLGLDGLVCTPHRLRHSCALRWYPVGKLLYEARFAHLDAEELRDFRVQFGDTWQLVQTVLGHRSVTTTMEVYLEPFRYLDVELLIEQTADFPIAELLDVAFRDHPRVAGDPLAAGAGVVR